MTEISALDFHPLANLFPLVEGEDFRDLVADVAAHGIHQPIDVWQGKILDGRNRYRAAQAAGIELGPQHIRHFRPELYGDPLAYVISANLKRRHLDDRQRASIAGKIANMARGRPPEAAPENPPIGGISAERAAAQLNVAPRQVERARVVHEQGVPELREALDRGELAVSAAEKIARLPEAEQRVELPKALPSGARAIMGSRAEPDDSLDYFPTPPWATRVLVEVVLARLGVSDLDNVFEPACGEGHIAEVLREYCEDVSASDVFDYGYGSVQDFLKRGWWLSDCVAEWIITNPPFGEKALPFVTTARAIAPNVAMFFRSQWAVEGVDRYEALFRGCPPTLCAWFVERVPLAKGRWDPDGSTATAYCWLVWMRGHQPLPPFWIPPGQRERLTRADDRERFTAHPVVRRDGGPIASIPPIVAARRAPHAAPALHSPANADDEIADMDAPQRESAGGMNVAASRLAGGRVDDEIDIPKFLRRDGDNRALWMHASSPASPDQRDAATAAAEFHGVTPPPLFLNRKPVRRRRND